MGDYLTPGYPFSGTSPNNVVTAEKLNALVAESVLKTTALTNRTELSALDSGDFLWAYDVSAGVFAKVTAGNAITSARGVPFAKNLVMFNATGSRFTQITVTADFILMRRASNGALYIATSFAGTADIALGVALNGLDAGVEAGNTWYYIHAISSGVLDKLLISTSPTSPVLPSGYPYSCLLGAVRNDSNLNFQQFSQHGNHVGLGWNTDASTADSKLLNPKTATLDFTNIAPSANQILQEADISQCVPPNITAAFDGVIGITHTSATRQMVISSNGTGSTAINALATGPAIGAQLFYLNAAQAVNAANGTTATAMAGFTAMGNFTLPLRYSQTLFWGSASGSGATGIISMRATGFTLALH